MNLKRKKLRKSFSLRKFLFMLIPILVITIGFSVLSVSLSVSGRVNVNKKKYNAKEVSYTNTANPDVETVHDALMDFYSIIQSNKKN